VLVLDRSGSMDGWKMVAARRAAARIVDTFGATDRFAVLTFDHDVETPPGLPSGSLVAGTDRNRFRAIEHLAGLTARGGTEMLGPLRQAASWLSASGARDKVIVLVTDGQVGNEDQILQSLAPLLLGVRVHTVGIDTAVNKAFLERLAGLAGGRCELVESEDRLDEAMRQINQRIGRPLVTDLRLVPDGLAVDTSTIAPALLPDLYPGAPVVITGRYHGEPSGGVTVTGSSWQTSVVASLSEQHGLRAIWARAYVRDLEDRYVTASFADHDALERQIVAVSLKYGVLCRFTAFVAVDDRVVNAGGVVHRVTQPVELPQGWQMPVAPQAVAFGAMDASASAPMPQPAGKARYRRTAAAMENAPLGAIIPALPVALHTFARQALDRLRATADRPSAERIRLLAELGAELVAVLDRVPGLPEETMTQLRDLAARLANPPYDVDSAWRSAVDLLEPLAGQPTRRGRPFWKR
jgi:Ca-activated chloride channel family protein